MPRILFAVLFIVAGTLHFLIPQTYVGIMPSYIPAHLPIVLFTGACEILGGLGLFFQAPIRTLAAWGLLALLVAVMPANIYMATHSALFPKIPLWALYLRLLLQLPLIAWAWLYTRR